MGRKKLQVTNVKQIYNKKPTNWWGRKNAAPLKFDPKSSEAEFSVFFSNFDKYQPEVAGDVISGVAVD